MCNAKRNNARLQQDGMSDQTFENTKVSLDARAIILQSAVRDALTLRFRIFRLRPPFWRLSPGPAFLPIANFFAGCCLQCQSSLGPRPSRLVVGSADRVQLLLARLRPLLSWLSDPMPFSWPSVSSECQYFCRMLSAMLI